MMLLSNHAVRSGDGLLQTHADGTVTVWYYVDGHWKEMR